MNKRKRKKVAPGEARGEISAANERARKPAGRGWQVLSVCAVLLGMVFLVFGQTLTHGFVNYDDNKYVYDNGTVVKGLTMQGVAQAITGTCCSNWHPLTMLSHMIVCQFCGLWAGGHHLANVLLHATSALLLFFMLREMTGSLWRSGFVAAVFAIHPLRVESVAWVAERKDVLSGIFFMLSLRTYARYGHNRELGKPATTLYVLVIVWFALGLMSKPMLVTLPFVLLLLDYWPLGRLRQIGQLPRLLKEKLPLLALSAASCVATVMAQRKTMQPWELLPVSVRLENALVAYAVYLAKLICPANLAVLYPLLKTGQPAWQLLAAIGLLGAISVGVFLLRRTQPFLIVGWLWYLGLLVPVIGIIQVGQQAYADRYTYLPQIGLCIAGTWGVAEWCKNRPQLGAALRAGAAVVLCLLLVVACGQTSYWRDSVTLWSHALDCTKDNSVAQNGLGNALVAQGRLNEAIQHYEQALHLNWNYPEAQNNLGNALFGEGKGNESVQHYEQALRLNPDLVEAHYNLGLTLTNRGKLSEAIQHFDEALLLKRNYPEAQNDLGNALFGQGRVTEAIEHYNQALQLKPDFAEAHYNLANALAGQGKNEDAVQHFEQALRFKRNYPDAYNNLGNALLAQARLDDAIQRFEQAVELQPDFAGAHYNLGNALANQGKMAEAIQHLQRALDLARAQQNAALAEAVRARLASYLQASPRSRTP